MVGWLRWGKRGGKIDGWVAKRKVERKGECIGGKER